MQHIDAIGRAPRMSLNAKRKLLFGLSLLALVFVFCFVLHNSIRIQYHKTTLTLKSDYAYRLIPFGNFLRARGIKWQWDIDPHEERDVEALVDLGYLIKRDFIFIPPLSHEEFQNIHLGASMTYYRSMKWELTNATIVVIARPDEMPSIARRIESFRKSRVPTTLRDLSTISGHSDTPASQ
jgi:hypothetical protein